MNREQKRQLLLAKVAGNGHCSISNDEVPDLQDAIAHMTANELNAFYEGLTGPGQEFFFFIAGKVLDMASFRSVMQATVLTQLNGEMAYAINATNTARAEAAAKAQERIASREAELVAATKAAEAREAEASKVAYQSVLVLDELHNLRREVVLLATVAQTAQKAYEQASADKAEYLEVLRRVSALSYSSREALMRVGF